MSQDTDWLKITFCLEEILFFNRNKPSQEQFLGDTEGEYKKKKKLDEDT